MILYCKKLSPEEVLCIFPDTSTWMYCSERELNSISLRFASLQVVSIDSFSKWPLRGMTIPKLLSAEDEEILKYFGRFSNRNERPDETTLYRNPIVSLTNRCFLKCAYCYVSSPSFTKDQFRTLETSYVISFINNLISIGGEKVFSVQYFGGEPTMHNDLPKLIEYTRFRNLQARISTNGVAKCIRSEDYIAAVEDYGVEWRISLDSIDPVVNDRSRGKGVFSAIMRNLEYMHKAGANISLKPVLTPENIAGLEDYLEFAYSHGFKFTYGTLLPVGDALKNNVKRSLTETDVASHLIGILQRKPHLIPTIELSPLGWTIKTIFLPQASALPRFTFYLHDDGFVYPMDGMIAPEFRIGVADRINVQKLVDLQTEYGLQSDRCRVCYLNGFCYTGDYHELRARDSSMQSEFYSCDDRRNIYGLLMSNAINFHDMAKIMLSSQYTS